MTPQDLMEPKRPNSRRFPQRSRFPAGPSYCELVDQMNREIPDTWERHSTSLGPLFSRGWVGHRTSPEGRFSFLILTAVAGVLRDHDPRWFIDIAYHDSAPVALVMANEVDEWTVPINFTPRSIRIGTSPRVNFASAQATDKLLDLIVMFVAAFFETPAAGGRMVH